MRWLCRSGWASRGYCSTASAPAQRRRRSSGPAATRARSSASRRRGRLAVANDIGRSSPSGEGGFTLLEMLVALSIIAIAALTLVRLDAYAVRSAGDLDESTVAGIVAQNRPVDLWTDPPPPPIGASITRVATPGRPRRPHPPHARTPAPH